ncbi:MAG: 4-alpha-glucanotransferase, partial [Nitrospira sp.]
MNNQSETELLRQLADRAGIASEYYDITGTLHVTSDDTRRAILRAMGLRTDTQDDLVAELTQWDDRSWLRICEPVYVVRANGAPASWSASIPCETAGELSLLVQWSLRNEDGAVCYERIEGPGLGVQEERFLAGRRYVRSAFMFPPNLSLGYYQGTVRVQGGAVECETAFLLIVAPARCYMPDCFLQGARLWGLSLQLYSLRSECNWGAGDFRDLVNIVEWAGSRLGAAIIGLNPLHALKNTMPYHISPYSPNSRLFLNEFYIDMASIPEFAAPKVQQQLADSVFQSCLDELRKSEFVDYDGVMRAKRVILELCYEAFLENNFVGEEPDLQSVTERGRAFETYVEQEGDSLRWYAVFQALDEDQRGAGVMQWTEWPAEFRHPCSDAVREYEHRQKRRVRFFWYLQWLAALQMDGLVKKSQEAGMVVGLYHDLALGSDRNGADGWRFQDLLA